MDTAAWLSPMKALPSPVKPHRVYTAVLVAGLLVVTYQLLLEIIVTGKTRREVQPIPRSGSSFFGGLFGNDPRGLYFYEPLDGLYGAMYGTSEGWNVPSDIMNWKDGSQRSIPEAERNAISQYLGDLLTCEYTNMPSEFVLHRFWAQFHKYQPHLGAFTSCLSKADQIKTHGNCHKHIARACSIRFGRDSSKQEHCMHILWNSTANRPNDPVRNYPGFTDYAKCMTTNLNSASHCVSRLMTLCHKSQIRSVKTVRATMESAESLIQRHANLRIIHLFRDPRAVALSRSKFHSSGRSMYAGRDLTKEAKLYCQNVVRDVKLRRQLERKYPGVSMEIVYDDFVLAALDYTRQIYNFMNVTLTEPLIKWVINNTQQTRNSSVIASKWISSLSHSQVHTITSYCRELFELVPGKWTP